MNSANASQRSKRLTNAASPRGGMFRGTFDPKLKVLHMSRFFSLVVMLDNTLCCAGAALNIEVNLGGV